MASRMSDDDWETLKERIAAMSWGDFSRRFVTTVWAPVIPPTAPAAPSVPDDFAGFVPISKTAEDVDMTIAPHPIDGSKTHATVRDVKRQRAWSGEGNNPSEAASEAMKKFLTDRHAREYMK